MSNLEPEIRVPLAGAADPSPALGDQQIVSGERMTMDTVSLSFSQFPGFTLGVVAPLAVDLVDDGFKMARSDAGTVPTKMIDLGPFWNGTDQHLIGVSMGEDVPLWSVKGRAEPPIPVFLLETKPDPAATRLFDFRPEAVFRKTHGLSVTHRED